jgi:PGF-CTERM protein
VTAVAGDRSADATVAVTVREPVTAALAVDRATVDPGETVTFDAGDSSGPIDSYEWEFGDGETAATTGAETGHSYDEPGTYTATVTAVAGDRSAGATVAVTVRPGDGDETSTGQPDDAGGGLLNASEDADGDGAGFGPGMGLVGLGGAAYLLRRLRSGESDDATDRSR